MGRHKFGSMAELHRIHNPNAFQVRCICATCIVFPKEGVVVGSLLDNRSNFTVEQVGIAMSSRTFLDDWEGIAILCIDQKARYNSLCVRDSWRYSHVRWTTNECTGVRRWEYAISVFVESRIHYRRWRSIGVNYGIENNDACLLISNNPRKSLSSAFCFQSSFCSFLAAKSETFTIPNPEP